MEKLILKYSGTTSSKDIENCVDAKGFPLASALHDAYYLCDKDKQVIVRNRQADFDDIVDWLKGHDEIRGLLHGKLGVSTLFFRVAEDTPGRFCIRCITSMSMPSSQENNFIELYIGD